MEMDSSTKSKGKIHRDYMHTHDYPQYVNFQTVLEHYYMKILSFSLHYNVTI